MHIKNTKKRYGLLSMLFHWSVAILILSLLPLGLYMTSLPDVGFSTLKIRLIFIHKELGMWVLILSCIRFLWRLTNTIPVLPEKMNVLQKVLAESMHLILYFYCFTLPLSGWLMSSAGHYPVFFLSFKLPDIIEYNRHTFNFFISVHKYLAFSLIALLVAHIGAALMHHLYYRDDILKRMLPFNKS